MNLKKHQNPRSNFRIPSFLFVGLLSILSLSMDFTTVPVLPGMGGISMAQKDPPNVGSMQVSMEGYTEITIQCTDCSSTPTKNFALLNNTKLANNQYYIIPITNLNVFKGAEKNGKLLFTLPPLYELVWDAPSQAYLQSLPTTATIPFQVSVLTYTTTIDKKKVQTTSWKIIGYTPYASVAQNAQVIYSLAYTAQLYYLSPRAMYPASGQLLGSEFSIFCDPRAAANVKTPNGITFSIDGKPQDLGSRGTDPNQNSLINGAINEIRARATTQQPDASAGIVMTFNYGNAVLVPNTIQVCGPLSADASSCYSARTLPRIDAVRQSQGFASGNQSLIIEGYGFQVQTGTATAVVKIQLTPLTDVECDIKEITNTRIRCITRAVSAPSSTGLFIGGPGVIRQIWQGYGVQPNNVNYNTYPDKNAYPTIIDVDEQIYLTIENPQNIRDNFFTKYFGLFVPRADGKYRFFLSCDDWCKITLQPQDKSSTLATFTLGGAIGYRAYSTSYATPQVSLLADKPYYIEVQHIEYGGGDHVSVGLEIEFPPTVTIRDDHPQGTKEVQRFTISQPQHFDTIGWTITNIVDAYNYTLSFNHPDRLGTILAQGRAQYTFNVTWDAATICAQIRYPIYQQVLGSDAVCTAIRYDANNATTTDWSKTKTIIVTVRSVRFLVNNAITAIARVPMTTFDTLATITTRASGSDGITISRPLTGYFQIQCFQKTGNGGQVGQGNQKYSNPIPVTASSAAIQAALEAGCPTLKKEELDVWEGGAFSGIIQNGRQIFLRFRSAWDPPQFIIGNCQDTTYPSVYGTIDNGATFENITTIAFNTHTLFYDQIPVEFLQNYKNTPQVKVSINGLEAVCPSQKCDYNYIATPDECQTITIQGNTVHVNCNAGQTMPSDCVLNIANIQCSLTLDTQNNYFCTLGQSIPTGQYNATISCGGGDIPYVGPVVQAVSLTVTSITPDHVNRLGGQELTVTGKDFPSELSDQVSVTVTYGGASCTPTAMTTTTITCESSAVGANIATGSQQHVEVCINSLCNSDLLVTIIAPPNVAKAFWPNPVSPVLRTNMFFLFQDNFAQPFDATVWRVTYTSTKDPTYVRKVAIRGNPELNQWRLRFLGAYAGTYRVAIRHITLGYIDTSALPLVDANSYIRTITPQSGSAYGGTQITITGGPFSNNGLENNVKVWNNDCLVESSSNDTIICTTSPRVPKVPVTDVAEQLDVFLKAAEYAVCALPAQAPCDFTWTNVDAGAISGYVISSDTQGDPTLSISGSFPSQSSADSGCCLVTIGGVPQSEITCNATNIQSSIDQVVNGNQVGPILVTCPYGYPAGVQLLASGGATAFFFQSLNVNVGSPAGTLITATIKGLGNDIKGPYKLLLANNQELCDPTTYNFIAFETLQCRTKVVAVTNQLVRFNWKNQDYACQNTDQSKCKYQTGTNFPVVTAVTLSADKFSFDLTVTNIITGWDAVCQYAGVYATTATVQGNKVTCWFQLGVPITGTAQKPVLFFQAIDSTVEQFATVNPTLVNHMIQTDNTLAGDVTCGHGGDCLLAISSASNPGLSSALRNGDVTITVCGKVCVFQLALSNATYTVCTLPRINNDYIQDKTDIKKQIEKKGSRDEKSDDSQRSGKSVKGSVHGTKQALAEKCFANNDDSEQKAGKYKKDENEKHFENEKKRLRILTSNLVQDKNDQEDAKKKQDEKDAKEQDLYVYNNNNNGWDDNTGNCQLGQKFPKGTIAILTEVQFFISPAGFSASKYHNVEFQGSNDDGHTWVKIFALSKYTIKQGWNYIEVDSTRYNYYQFKGTPTSGSCTFGKVKLIGITQVTKTHQDDVRNCTVHETDPNPTGYETCTVLIDWGDGTTTPVTPPNNGGGNPGSGGGVGYDPSLNSVCTGITPSIGSVYGGDLVTITGTNFSPDITLYTIFIDSVKCEVISATDTSVTCRTGPRVFFWDNPKLEFRISGNGNVYCGVKFTYGYRWSNDATWGEDGQPEEFESVWVPKGLVLIVDVPNPPPLKEVIVEGGLVFDPYLPCTATPQTFDAFWIFANGGNIQIGTEDVPITCQLIITLHGDRYTPEVPLYGNEVIGVRYGTLDIHGKKILPPWIDLDHTANVGDKLIQLYGQVDWNVDDHIVIASTSYNLDEVETRIITSIDRTDINKPIIHFADGLLYKHLAVVESCSSRDVEMRGEVGLLTRNIVIQGDANSVNDENGAVISVLSDGDDSSIVRIEYVEFRQMGQAYKLGRYALHMRVVGKMAKSYIRGNSLNKSYNRFLAFNQVRSLLAEWNVVYDVKGHAFFTEIGNEEDNIIHRNLVITNRISWSLQNTDQTPSAYFIQNPKNIITENRAAGSEGYGFWFNLPASPFGVNNNPGICPNANPLGAFDYNAAHSSQRDGLKQIATYNPRTTPCLALDINPASATYNPSVPASLSGFRSWKNRGDGATFDRVGDVRTVNYTAADNLGAGIEYSLTDLTPDGTAQVNDATIVGFSLHNTDATQNANVNGWGVQTARSENFQVNNVRFCSLPNNAINKYAAIKTCSNCDVHYTLTDSGARTVTFSGLSFSSVDQYITYTWPKTDILYDLDGTLTGLGASSWAIYDWKHNEQPECSALITKYNGLICDNRVEVRRIVFYNYQPSYFDWADMKILKYDAYLSSLGVNPVLTYTAAATPTPGVDYVLYDQVQADYTVLPFKQYTLPNNAWAVPFVTKHSYKIHWRTGLDFQRFTFELSPRWKNQDHDITLIFNHTDVRETIMVNITNLNPVERIPRDSLVANPIGNWQLGDNRLYNESTIRQLHVIANGRNLTRKQVTLFGYNCLLWCPIYIDYSTYQNGEPACPGLRYWSLPTSWESGHVPLPGENVLIRRNCVYIYDVPNSVLYNSVVIEGRVIWDTQDSLVMNTKFLFVKGGWLQIGNSTTEFFAGSLAEIKLWGTFSEQYLAFSTWIEAGGKVLAITGEVRMFGKSRTRRTRLVETALAGATTIKVSAGLDWVAGDQIALAATNTNHRSAEQRLVQSYDKINGVVTLDKALSNSHFGLSETDINARYPNADIRGEVYLLTSNVRVSGNNVDSWGGHIVVSQYIENDGRKRNGTLLADNIEVYNCSQYDTFKAALRFESVQTLSSSVSNSVFRNGLGKGLQVLNSKGVTLQNNIFFDFVQWGGNVQASSQIVLDGNVFFHIGIRLTAGGQKIPPNGGLLICAYAYPDTCHQLSVINNIVSGADYAGFGAPGVDCTNDMKTKSGAWFRDNVAHSINGNGAIFFADPTVAGQSDCFQAQSLVSYKNKGYGVITYSSSKSIQFVSMTLIDNYWNAGMLNGLTVGADELVQRSLIYSDVSFYGDSPVSRDCDTENACVTKPETCENKVGVMLSQFTMKSNTPFPRDLTPSDEIFSDSQWNGYALYQDCKFIDYNSDKLYCGGNQQLFDYNRNGTDLLAIQRFVRPILKNVDEVTFGKFRDPLQEWAVVEKCGNFPCTGPKNIILSFEGLSVYADTCNLNLIQKTGRQFYIISNNDGIGTQMGCLRVDKWNGYYCNEDTKISQIIFESLDDDKMTRTFSPMNITTSPLTPSFTPILGYKNTLNSFSDKGFTLYGGQQRRTRFPFTLRAREGLIYNVTYTGTVPKNQRFRMDAQGSQGVVVSIRYTEQNSYSVKVLGVGIIDYNPWDSVNNQMKSISTDAACGQNRYLAVVNILEFMIKPGCTIEIAPRDVILASVRLEWTVTDFYSGGGTTLFIDRISAVLGVHPSTVKIVGVASGSVIINYQISNPTESKQVLPQIKAKIDTVMKIGASFLGAPILDYDATFPVPQDEVYVPPTAPVVNNTKPVIIAQNLTVSEEQIGPAMTKQQVAKLAIIIGVVLGVCITVSVIVYCICKKRKETISIHVQQKGDNTTTRQGINISQEYDTQYHPKQELGKVFDFDEIEKKKKAKAQIDNLEEQEEGEQQKNTEDEEWRQDWGQTDTVRTNANKYTDENYLMNSPTAARPSEPLQFSNSSHSDERPSDAEPVEKSNSDVKKNESEIYIDTE